MDVLDKLSFLAAAAKYDTSCASSGSKRQNTTKGLGNASDSPLGICHSWSADGRCISLLKVLFTNYCIHDCVYCINRRSNDIPRATFTVNELVDLTVNFYRRNYIEGLFLSSGVVKSPDYTMELLIQVIRRLRQANNFNGYIHVKVIPGTSRDLVKEAGNYADRLSVNIELPSEQGLKKLAPDKKKEDILVPMAYIGNQIQAIQDERKYLRSAPLFAPAGQSTQLIVGASPESDFQILNMVEKLYQKVRLRRVYYSAYIPVNQKHPLLPKGITPPLKRENRLYQADWLLRFYKFKANEIVSPDHPFLDTELDPKTAWALRNFHHFPMEINRVDYEYLLRIPGVGVQSAQRIVAARRFGPLKMTDLPKLGVVLKRASYFITCNGQYLEKTDNATLIRRKLLTDAPGYREVTEPQQLTLF